MKSDRQIIFSPFRLDVTNQRLYRGDELIPLRPKSFAVLQYLLANAGKLVTKEQLLEVVWPETSVSDTVLKVCVRELREALGDDPKTPRFIETAHRSGYCFIAEVKSDNLPVHLTSFVGRESELSEVKRLLSGTRLLTLVGAGGSGKTRLAARTARDVMIEFEDGAWWVELASLSDPALVTQMIATALSVREQPGRQLTQTLCNELRAKSLLLILDNCEHLVDVCAALTDTLLRACPRLKILTTSREPLGVSGEIVWPVPPLSLPDLRHLPQAEELVEYEAMRLFIERACAAQPNFAPTEEETLDLAQVVHKLDGMPLAIELAAPRVKVLSIEQIAARLDDCFNLLTAGGRTQLPRHQTLRATIDWSYDLLSKKERMLLCRLSVFSGGWTLEAAELVCTGAGIERKEILDLLTHLVDKSLVTVAERESGAQRRYRLLETVRQYGHDRLVESGNLAAVEERHAAFFLKLAEEIEPKINTAARASWLATLDTEHDNLRAALTWAAAAGEVDTVLRLCGSLFWFWLHRGYWSEGRSWLEGALAQSTVSSQMRARAKALHGEGLLAWTMGDHAMARSRLEESMAIFRELRDDIGLAHVLHFLALEIFGQGLQEEARKLAEESVAKFRQHGTDKFGLAVALASLGIVALGQADYAPSREHLEESVRLCREINDNWALSLPLRNLGAVELRLGEYDRAILFLRESLVVQREQKEKWFVSRSLETLAEVVAQQGDLIRAARLFGAAEALREAVGASVLPVYKHDYDRGVATVRAGLTEERVNSAWLEGRNMVLEQAVAYALFDSNTKGQSG